MEKPYAGNPEKFEVVFDGIGAFSTNLSTQDLADEAFLRRAGRKLAVDCARPEERVEISRSECARQGLVFRDGAVRRYEGRTPELEAALICRAYHGDLIES